VAATAVAAFNVDRRNQDTRKNRIGVNGSIERGLSE